MGLEIVVTDTKATISFTHEFDSTHIMRKETPTTYHVVGSKDNHDGEYGAEAWAQKIVAEFGGTITKVEQPSRRIVSDITIRNYAIDSARAAFAEALEAYLDLPMEDVEQALEDKIAELKAKHQQQVSKRASLIIK